MRRHATFAVLVAATALAACENPFGPSDDDGFCTAELRFGVAVNVIDSLTGARVAAGSRLVIREGAYADSVTLPADSVYNTMSPAGAAERPGTYSLTVTKPGYQTWTRTGVRVEAGRCHVKSVTVDARLQRTP